MADHMTLAKQLGALGQIADIMLDQRLLALRVANTARTDTQNKLAALDVAATWQDCSLQSSARAEMLYQSWADARRKELNLNLARQTVTKMQAEEAARLAFSRQTALQKLQAHKRGK
jgi:hypothetical protein